MSSETLSASGRFFVLKHVLWAPHDTEASQVKPNLGPAPRCPQCGQFIGALTWQPPYRIELQLHGKEFGDLIEGPGGDLLVTERFAKDFKAEGLTGLSGFHPVEVVRVRGKRRLAPGSPPPYLFVTVTYGPPALDIGRSRLKYTKPPQCTWCRETGVDAIDGLALEAGTWSGEDIFRPRGLWGSLVVSERFMRFAERHAMSHMARIPIEQYVWGQ